jgi:hypothetical protein
MKRLRDIVAPVRPPGEPTGYRRLLRWAALPVTDRRWAAPLCAAALGFGLFAGVAIGPGTSGSLAIGTPQVIEIPSLLTGGGGAEEVEAEGGGLTESSSSSSGESNAFEAESSSSEFIPSFEEEEAPESSGSAEPSPSSKEKESAKEEGVPEEEAQPVSGVVVHVNPAAGSYTLVESGGLLSAVHTAKPPTPGAQISVPVRTLANGTFAEAGPRKQTGMKTQTSFQGIVTFVDPDPATPAYAVSKRGASVLVKVRPDPTGALAQLPQLGAYATVAVEIEKTAPAATPPASEALPPTVAPPPAETPVAASPIAPTCAPDLATPPPAIPAPVAVLWQQELDADGAPFASSDFEGVVMAVCPEQGTLLLSADDLRESGNDLLFTVPKSIDIGKLKAGDSVAATAAIDAGGALTLTGLASDERTKGADNDATAEGDLVSHQPK